MLNISINRSLTIIIDNVFGDIGIRNSDGLNIVLYYYYCCPCDVI